MSGLVTQDFQVEFDGLLFGPGTAYGITSMAGFLDMAGVRAQYTNRARRHGTYTEPQYAGGAIYDVEFDVTATTGQSFNAAVTALQAGTYPQTSGTRPLWFQLPGQGLLQINAQVVRRAIPIDVAFQMGIAQKAAVQFYAPDPLKYGPQQSGATGLPTGGGGLTYPLTYPLAYGAAGNPGRVSASNGGSAAASPVFTVTGPIDSAGFSITTVEDGTTLQFNGGVGVNDTIVIDTRVGSVTLNGSTDRRYLLSFSAWPQIPANTARTFQFSALGAYQAAALLTVGWANVYW